MTDDLTLSREAALIYQYVFGFEPLQGSLKQWGGIIKDSSGNAINMIVNIPDDFPNSPPSIHLPDGTSHLGADEQGRIITRSYHHWKDSMHVFQIIKEAKQILSASPVKNATSISTDKQDEMLRRQIQMLQQQLSDKRTELNHLENQSTSITNVSQSQVAAETLDNIEAELWALEDSYDTLEIDEVKFSKKFLQLRKRYYLIQQSR
ncbi:MAG: hypothetical protein INQ03_15155 [Candidatus Heimdallarchaeota archaeon]|nr:hypothetical protein [Candidatus Heimdallarchaeota archaeon]